MPSLADLTVFSADGQPVLIVECKTGKEPSAESAARFRHNLISHDLLPPGLAYLLAYPTKLFLWPENTLSSSDLPSQTASTQSIRRDYLSGIGDRRLLPGSGSLEIGMQSWLDDLVIGLRKPNPESEADQLLVKSGLYDRVRGGKVSSRLAL